VRGMRPLAGERLYLRPVQDRDLRQLAQWLADPEIRRLVGPRFPRVAHRSWAYLSPSPHDAQFAIVLRAGDRPIGVCGLFGISEKEGTAELGIVLGEKHMWGHGYGREALVLLLGHAYGDLGLRQVSLCVHAANARAIRAYEKVGFIPEGRFRVGRWLFGQGVEFLVMGMSIHAWRGPCAVEACA